jgi:hypothetical protein
MIAVCAAMYRITDRRHTRYVPGLPRPFHTSIPIQLVTSSGGKYHKLHSLPIKYDLAGCFLWDYSPGHHRRMGISEC